MTSPIQEIKERLDIVEFIRSYIPLKPAGKNFKALCPFHKEKTPSFMVSPERQTWHCFGSCSEGGDIFKFLMKYENLEFYEALKVLAEKAGVELKKISPAEQKQFGILYDINNSAKDFFVRQLAERTDNEILNYLSERGLRKETIEEFELGLAPASFDDLTRYLINFGYDVKDIERAGLNFKNERGNYTDRFRQRIMFPIHNYFGKTVGFSGRILPHLESLEVGKYINSPETPIFNKSRLLYGFHKSKEAIRQSKTAVLVEGQMDFLMAYQDGVKNTIASSGTGLTFAHLKTLRRLAEQLILYFDNDEAGIKAAERAIDLANNADFNVKLLIIKDYKDPAEAVQKKPGLLVNFINEAKPAMEFYFEHHLKEISSPAPNFPGQISNLDLANFKNAVRVVLNKIKNLASPVERNHWLKQLSLRTKIEEKFLLEEMEQIKSEKLAMGNEQKTANNQNLRASPPNRKELIAQRLISLAITDELFRSRLKDYSKYLPANYLLILENINNQEKLKDERLNDLLNLIHLRSSFESSVFEDEEKINQEFKELLQQLKLEALKEKRQKLIYLIKEAEQNGNQEQLGTALKEFDQILKMMLNNNSV